MKSGKNEEKERGRRKLSCFGQKLSLGGRMVVLKRVLNCSQFGIFSLVLWLGPCWQRDLYCGHKNSAFVSFKKMAGISLSSQQECLFFDFTVCIAV